MDYQFKKIFQVADQGKMVDAISVTVEAPSNVVSSFVNVIDSAYAKASMKASEFAKGEKKNEAKKDIELNGTLITMLLGAGGCDVEQCFSSLREILVKTGKINGSIPVTGLIFEKMSFADTKELLGLYIKDFLSISLQD